MACKHQVICPGPTAVLGQGLRSALQHPTEKVLSGLPQLSSPLQSRPAQRLSRKPFPSHRLRTGTSFDVSRSTFLPSSPGWGVDFLPPMLVSQTGSWVMWAGLG